MKVFEDTDWTEHRAAATGQAFVRELAWREEVLKEWKWSMSRHSSMFGFFKQSSVTHTWPLLPLHIGDGDTDDTPTVREEVRPS